MSLYNSLKAHFLGMNFAYLLILALVGKALISDVSVATFLITIPVIAFESYKLYLKHKTPPATVVTAELRQEIDNIKSKVNAATFEKGLRPTTADKRYF